jgi:mannose-6-phosphate isomerase-like protein (cupin superfamily)
MGFALINKKGLAKYLMDSDIDPEKFSLHISEIGPVMSSHPCHAHDGIEAIYVFYGEAIVEIEAEQNSIGPNQVIVMDASKSHRLTNIGTMPLRYMVVRII